MSNECIDPILNHYENKIIGNICILRTRYYSQQTNTAEYAKTNGNAKVV